MMKNPLSSGPRLWLAASFVLAAYGVGIWLDHRITPGAPWLSLPNLLEIQFLQNQDAMQRVGEWKDLTSGRIAIYYDFFFLTLYAIFGWLALKRLHSRAPRLIRTEFAWAIFPFAAICDAAENVLSLRLLNGQDSMGLLRAFAVAKFLSLAIGIGLILLFETPLWDFLFSYEFFISYRQSDGKGFTVKLRDALERLGYRCFVDLFEYEDGVNINEEGERKLKNSKHLVIVVSKEVFQSWWVLKEFYSFKTQHGEGASISLVNLDGALEGTDSQTWLKQVVRPADVTETEAQQFLKQVAQPLNTLIGKGSLLASRYSQIGLEPSDELLREMTRKLPGIRARRRWLLVLGGALSALFLLIVLALSQYARMLFQKNEAQRQSRMSQGRVLAAHSQEARRDFPHLGLQYALDSLKTTFPGDPQVPESEQALRDALQSLGGRSLAGHHSWVVTTAVSPDGRWAASGDIEGGVRVYPTQGGSPTVELRREKKDSLQIAGLTAFSEDSQWFAAAAGSWSTNAFNDLVLWKVGETKFRILAHREPVTSVLFQKDRLVTGSSSGRLRVWNLRDGQILQAPAPTLQGIITDIQASPGSESLVVAEQGGSFCSWNLPESRQNWLHPAPPRAYSPVAISQDARVCARMNHSSHAVEIFDLESQGPNLRQSFPVGDDPVWELQISSKGRRLISVPDWKSELGKGAARPTYFWDLEQAGKGYLMLPPVDGTIFSASFSADEQRLATGGAGHSVSLWNLNSMSEPPVTLGGHDGSVWSVALSSKWLVSGGEDQRVRLWPLDSLNNACGQIEVGSVRALATCGNVAMALSGDKAIYLDVSDPLLPQENSTVTGVSALLSNGNHFFLAKKNGAVEIREVGGELVRSYEHPNFSAQLLTAIDGRRLALASNWDENERKPSYRLAYADLSNKHATKKLHVIRMEQEASCIALTPDGRYLFAGDGKGTIRRWDLSQPQLKELSWTAHTKNITQLICLPETVFSTSWDGSARAWNLQGKSQSDPIKIDAEGRMRYAAQTNDGILLGGDAARVRFLSKTWSGPDSPESELGYSRRRQNHGKEIDLQSGV